MKEVAWVRVSPLNRKKPVVRVEGCPLEESLIVRGLDGSCFKGRIMDGSTDSVRIKTVMEDKPWEVSMKGVAELKWVALEPFAGAETDEMEAFDQWERGKLVTRGQWVPGEGGSPRWRVDGGDRAVPIRITDKWTIRRSVLGGTEGVMLPGLAHLDSGEIVPAEVVSWTEEEVKLRSLIAAEEETSRLPAEKVRALELAGEGLKVSGFQDPGWVMVREGEKGAKMDRVKGKVELSSGSLVGHGSFMQGTKLSFKVGSSQSYGALRVRLFADGLGEKSASLTLLVMRSGNTVYCGVEDPRHPGQIRGNTNRLPVEYEKPYDFSIRWSANQLQAWVNGMPAMTHALTDASRSGTGLLIEPAGLWGNSVQPQEVSHMRLDGATGARARPTMDSETRTWALQIPRRATENRPRHLLMAKNGDVLRGVVEEVNGEQVRLRSGLEMFEVPRERVALMVIPGEKVDDSTKGIEQKKTGPAIRFATADGAEFSLKAASLGPEWVEGDSPVLGKCRVRAELVRRLDSGEEHRHAGAFEGWNFVKAPDPLLPEETGGEGASLKGQAAPGFDLELASGGRFKLEDVKGKVVVLDFWASWCGPCLKAMPELLEAMKEFPNEKVLVVGVNQGQAMAEVKAFLKARKWELEVALDLDQKVGDLFGVKGIPHTVVVGPNGKVEWVSEGYSVAMAKELREVVLKLLP
jgi:thiol-disulfide isomerase/thioredoxin